MVKSLFGTQFSALGTSSSNFNLGRVVHKGNIELLMLAKPLIKASFGWNDVNIKYFDFLGVVIK